MAGIPCKRPDGEPRADAPAPKKVAKGMRKATAKPKAKENTKRVDEAK